MVGHRFTIERRGSTRRTTGVKLHELLTTPTSKNQTLARQYLDTFHPRPSLPRDLYNCNKGVSAGLYAMLMTTPVGAAKSVVGRSIAFVGMMVVALAGPVETITRRALAIASAWTLVWLRIYVHLSHASSPDSRHDAPRIHSPNRPRCVRQSVQQLHDIQLERNDMLVLPNDG